MQNATQKLNAGTPTALTFLHSCRLKACKTQHKSLMRAPREATLLHCICGAPLPPPTSIWIQYIVNTPSPMNARDPNLHFVALATASRNPGRISPKTLLGPLGHPGPSADLLPDLLPLVRQEAQMFSGILVPPTIPPPRRLGTYVWISLNVLHHLLRNFV